MQLIRDNDQTSNYFILLGTFLSLSILLLVFLPEYSAFFNSLKAEHFFAYVNAWDEETYLSYQGALGVRHTPGYWGLYLVSWLHELGLSGAIQNLLFDTLLLPGTLYFTTLSINTITNNKKIAFLYATIALFSSILFNYANPLILNLYGLPRHLTTIMVGYENYPSILRAPNPLFSYFFLSIIIYYTCKTKKKWLLIVPIPFLYYFVLQPYCYCLAVLSLSSIFKRKNSIQDIFLFNIFAFIMIATFTYIAYALLISPVDKLQHQHLSQ